MPPDRAVLVMGAMGAQGESGDTAETFAGCANRTRVAAYLAATAAEQRIMGALFGLAVGVVAGAAGAIYLSRR